MRSALTVLGVVIGITSIVGMTSLIRGFDESLRDVDPASRGRTRSSCRSSACLSFASGKSFLDLLQAAEPHRSRTRARSRATRRRSAIVDVWLGAMAATSRSRIYYRSQRTKQLADRRRDRELRRRQLREARDWAASSSDGEVEHRRQVVVLGQTPVPVALPQQSIRSARRSASAPNEFTVIGVLDKRPSRRASAAARTTSPSSRTPRTRSSTARCSRPAVNGAAAIESSFRSGMIARRAAATRTREQAMREVEPVMRIRHNLQARPAERLRPRDAGRHPQGLRPDHAGACSWRSSSSRRSR